MKYYPVEISSRHVSKNKKDILKFGCDTYVCKELRGEGGEGGSDKIYF